MPTALLQWGNCRRPFGLGRRARASTAANIDKVLQVFGTFGILAGLLFIALGVAIGWLLGGPDVQTKRVMSLGTGQRNIAAALVVASQSFDDPKVVVMVIVVAIVGLIILMPLSRALAKGGLAQHN